MAGLLGLVARPGGLALGLDAIDDGIAAAVTSRAERSTQTPPKA